jgi:hypothetical protein
MIEELVSRVFATRDAAHREHWKTKSFAKHSALGEFYDALPGKIDMIVEMYQGAFGLIEPKSGSASKIENIVQHIADEADWIDKNRSKIAEEVCAIENALDELCGLYLTTFYKLKNLS